MLDNFPLLLSEDFFQNELFQKVLSQTLSELLTLCNCETPKWVLWQTVKTLMKCHIMWHFIWVFKRLDPDMDRHNVGLDLGPNCLHRLSEDDKICQEVHMVSIFSNHFILVNHIWASSRENLPSGICEQQRRRPACASVQSDQRCCYLLVR